MIYAFRETFFRNIFPDAFLVRMNREMRTVHLKIFHLPAKEIAGYEGTGIAFLG